MSTTAAKKHDSLHFAPTPLSATEFSRQLSIFISESGCSVYKLSQMSGLGRTAIQHAMSGKLLPTREFVDKLCSVLIITPVQRDELIDLYTRIKLGDKVYNSRMRIKSIIENAMQPEISSDFFAPYAMDIFDFDYGSKAVSGKINVNNLLCSLIIREAKRDNPSISFTLPFSNRLFFDILAQILNAINRPLNIEHFLRLYKDEPDSCANINILENAIRLSMLPRISYTPYYYYAYKAVSDDVLSPFPYCFATGEIFVQISADFDNAIIAESADVNHIMSRHLNYIRSHSMPLVEKLSDEKIEELFSNASSNYNLSLNYQPCILEYVPHELINRHISHDIPDREKYIQLAYKLYPFPHSDINSDDTPLITFYSLEGLWEFAETGRLNNIPKELYTPLTPNERIELMEMMKTLPQHFAMLDPSKLSLPCFWEIDIRTNKNVVISCQMADKRFIYRLTESGLCSAFEDFLMSLSDMRMTFPADKAAAEIDRCIEHTRSLQ